MADVLREFVAVVVASDSVIGHLAGAVDQAARHLPSPGQQRVCPCCSSEAWPCGQFREAGEKLVAAGLRLEQIVPSDLHQRLWPRGQ